MAHIDLPAEISLHTVADLHVQFTDIIRQSGPVTLQAGAVENLDTAGIQLLLALSRTLCSQAQSLSWQNPSSALLESAQTLGVADALNLTNT